MSKDPSRKIAMKLVYYLVVAKSSEWDYKHFKLMIIIMYYKRELTTLCIAYSEVKVLRKVKNSKNSEERGGKPSKRAQARKTIFTAFGKGGQGHALGRGIIFNPGTK